MIEFKKAVIKEKKVVKTRTKIKKEMKIPIVRKEEKCPFCQEMFISSKMKNHVTSAHLMEKDNPLYSKFIAGIKPFVCEGCGESFYIKANLNTHMKSSHPEMKDKFKKYQCDKCERTYSEYYSLKDHKKRKHGNCVSVLCNSCGKEFNNKYLLDSHMRRAHNKKQECTECGKSFSYKQELTIHIKMAHLGVFDIQCPTCGKGFTNKKLMECHVKEKHEKIKPLHCEMCVYRSFRVGNLNLHRSKTHQLNYITKNDYKIMVESGQNPFCDKIDYDVFRYAI